MTNHLEQYFTPPEVTRALLARLAIGGMTISEPCAGAGWISQELGGAGYKVRASDVDPKYTQTGMGVDFFSRRAAMIHQDTDAIITNPPWSDAARFVRRALEFTPNVAMLLRLTFLEPCESTDDSRRVDLLQNLTACIVLPRVSFYKGKRGTDSVPPAWFIWGFDWLDLPMLDIVSSGELARHAGQQDLLTLIGDQVDECMDDTQGMLEVGQ